jgi:hypothetical protein
MALNDMGLSELQNHDPLRALSVMNGTAIVTGWSRPGAGHRGAGLLRPCPDFEGQWEDTH